MTSLFGFSVLEQINVLDLDTLQVATVIERNLDAPGAIILDVR